MKRFALVAALLLSAPFAHAAPPSEAQVDRLLQVMDIGRTMDGVLAQMQQATQQLGHSMLGEEATDEQRAKFDKVMADQHALLRRTLTAERLQPVFREVYTDVFTAEEVQAMTEFYSSEAGRGILQKMPQAAGRSMQAMQPLMQEMLQQVRQSLEQELKADSAASATN